MPKQSPNTREDLITIVGTNYIDNIVPDLLEKCFDIYKGRNFSQRGFQVSVLENTYATASIVLTVLGIEAYRNRIFHLERRTVGRNVAVDIASLLHTKEPTFPKQVFEEILQEVFVLRDVIVHNHVYKVRINLNNDYEMLSHRQVLLEGYGDNDRFRNFVNNRIRKTVKLGLNVQPAKVGFEELFLVLFIFDSFVNITEKILSRSYIPFNFAHKLENEWVDNLSNYLSYFYIRIPNHSFLRKCERLFNSLSSTFEPFLQEYKDQFLSDRCPNCKSFGFHQPQLARKCYVCGFEIGPLRQSSN